MATGSGAFPTKAGYNQSGGGYYILLASLNPLTQLNTYTPGTGSGGATTVGSFATGDTVPVGVSTLFGQYRLVKDMGKTVVSAGRTFRKIQAVQPAPDYLGSTFGVTGGAATASNTGYATYYVETGRDGANADASLAPMARYF